MKITNILFMALLLSASFNLSAMITLHISNDWVSGSIGVAINENHVRIAWDNTYSVKPQLNQRVVAVFNRKVQQEFFNSGLAYGYKWNADSAATTWGSSSSGGGGGGEPCISPDGCDEHQEYYDPLIIDLAGDGLHFGAKEVGVLYDFTGDGIFSKTQWMKEGENDAFLILDANNNGIVDNGSELFGTNQMQSLLAVRYNGFEHLALYDENMLGGNSDEFIDHHDAIWPYLALWLDTNADGISTKDEMHKLEKFKINRLPTVSKANNRQDGSGNIIPFWQWIINLDDNRFKYKIVDVYFRGI